MKLLGIQPYHVFPSSGSRGTNGVAFVRIRLEAKWVDDGTIDGVLTRSFGGLIQVMNRQLMKIKYLASPTSVG
jgi:hypothetical protein